MYRTAIIGGVLLAFGLQVPLSADTYHVPGDADDIQAAIDMASSGDEIIVAPGTYPGNINFLDKNLVVRSSDGADVTIIDAGGATNVVTFNGGQTRLTAMAGFTLTGGAATWGAAVQIYSCGPKIRNCIVLSNPGGGMSVDGSNRPDRTKPLLIDCTIADNGGRGLSALWAFGLEVRGCTFSGNTGGAMATQHGGVQATDCVFVGNSAPYGGVMYGTIGISSFTNCAFSQNNAASGGALFSHDNTVYLQSCSFTDNTATVDGGAILAEWGAGLTLTDCDFSGNVAGGMGGGIAASDAQLKLSTTAFVNNTAITGGGMVVTSPLLPGYGELIATSCLFEGNSATGNGGALWMGSGVSVDSKIVNSTLASNTAVSGGAIWLEDIPLTRIRNSIVWYNSDPALSTVGATLEIQYSDIEGGWPDIGNIDAAPLFVDLAGGDCRLAQTSPCIDAGINSALTIYDATDVEGNPRRQNDLDTVDTGAGGCPIVDMGSYEFSTTCAWDLDCSETVNTNDLLLLIGAWGSDPSGPPDFDGDGNVATSDLLALLANWGECN